MIDEARLYQLLGERLRALRESSYADGRRTTQAELASLVGLERTSITNIEKGAQRVSLHVLYSLCKSLDANVADVLPLLSEVTREQPLPSKTEVQFGGKTYKAPPKTAQIISEFLDMNKL